MAGLLRNIIGNKEQELLEAARHGKVDVVEKLVYKNLKGNRPAPSPFGISWPVRSATNVNCVDSNGYTPLHLAVLHGHKVTVETLLTAEALPSLPDHSGCTTLHLAAWKGYPEICQLVLANEGVPINIQDSNGDTALHYAAQYGYGSVVDVLIQHNADPSFRNLKQESALDLAAQYGHVEVVNLLVQKFPYLSQRLIPNRSPLHLAAACGHRKIVEILLDAGFDINTKTDNGTALHVAVMYFKPEIVSVLLERGTDLMGVDRNGHTAQDIAAQTGGGNSKVSLVIQEYIQKLQDFQKAMKEGEAASPEEDQPSPEEERPSPRPRPRRNSSPKKEDLYAKPNKRDRSQDKKLEEPEDNTGNELVVPPIPPRSVSLLEEMAKHLPSIAGIVKDAPPAPFNPVPHQPFPSPPKNSPTERRKDMPPRQPSLPATWDIPGLPPTPKQRHNSGGDRKPVAGERRPSDGNPPYSNISQAGGPKKDYINIGEVAGHDEPPPPRACPGESASVHVSVSALSTAGESMTSSLKLPKKTPPQKPKRSKPPASSPRSGRSPQGQQNRSPVPPRRDGPPLPDTAEPIMDYLPLRKPQEYMSMSEAKKEHTEDYMSMNDAKREPTEVYMSMSDAKREPTEDYMTMSNAKKEPMEDYMKMGDAKRESMEDYMKMTEVKKGPSEDRTKMCDSEKGPTQDYINISDVSKRKDGIADDRIENEKTENKRMSDVSEDDNDTYKDMYKILNLNRDRDLSLNESKSSRSSSSHNTETKRGGHMDSSSSSSSSSEDLLSSDSGELYINRPSVSDEDVFYSNQEHKGDKMVRSVVTEKSDNIPDIPLPRRPTAKPRKSSQEEPPVLPMKTRPSQRLKDPNLHSEKKRRSRYDNVQCEETVVPSVTGSKGDNSSCDQSFCDKNKDSVVIDKTLSSEMESRLSEDLLPDTKRLSNGVHHVEDTNSIKHLGEGKLAKPPSLEFEKKRLIGKEIPLTPTGYPQPATPDFPPPSPNTAMQGIQEKMAGIDSKRSSRDMETITETVYLRDLMEQPSSAVNIPKVDNISGANDIPFADDVSSISSSGDDLCVKKGAVDEGLPSGPSGDQTDLHSSPVVMRRSRHVHAKIQPPDGAAEMRRSTGSASSSSQEDLMREDELGPLAGLLRGSVVGRPRRVVSQIWDNVKHRKYLRAKKRQSLPTTGLRPFDPLMEKEEDVDKKMIDSISATRMSMTTGTTETDANHFDDTADWAQIQVTLDSVGVGMARESVFVKEYLNTFTEHLTSQGSSKVKCLADWLEDLNLDQYENTLVPNGYDNIDFLGGKLLEDQDLEHIGIKNSEHRKQILDAARQLPEIKPIDPDNPPATVQEWLESLSLETYIDSFKSHNKDTMDQVLKLWEVELQTVLDISAIGHRKRILASLGERKAPERQYPSLKKRLDTQPTDTESSSHRFNVNLYKDYTGVKPLTSSEEDVKESSQGAFPPDSSEDEDIFRAEKQLQGVSIRDDSLHLRPPHQATITSPIKEWRHPPVMLIKGYCNYMAQYLGSTLVKELSGPNSTIEGISKLKKSADVIAKIPTIKLAISFRGVKFIDAKSERVICDHEIGNIFCACQDADNMNFFAYITRDNENHYCHVFSVKDASLAREIILTLGEAFEVAYQMALKEKAQTGALEFDRQMSQSDVEPDSISISSKASINTV